MRLFQISCEEQRSSPQTLFIIAENEQSALSIAHLEGASPTAELKIVLTAEALNDLPPRLIARQV